MYTPRVAVVVCVSLLCFAGCSSDYGDEMSKEEYDAWIEELEEKQEERIRVGPLARRASSVGLPPYNQDDKEIADREEVVARLEAIIDLGLNPDTAREEEILQAKLAQLHAQQAIGVYVDPASATAQQVKELAVTRASKLSPLGLQIAEAKVAGDEPLRIRLEKQRDAVSVCLFDEDVDASQIEARRAWKELSLKALEVNLTAESYTDEKAEEIRSQRYAMKYAIRLQLPADTDVAKVREAAWEHRRHYREYMTLAKKRGMAWEEIMDETPQALLRFINRDFGVTGRDSMYESDSKEELLAVIGDLEAVQASSFPLEFAEDYEQAAAGGTRYLNYID